MFIYSVMVFNDYFFSDDMYVEKVMIENFFIVMEVGIELGMGVGIVY